MSALADGLRPAFIPIADYGRAITPRHGPRLIAVIYAYLDASKTEVSKGFTVVAGYVAPLAEWGKVEAEWAEAVNDWRIPKFHLSELPTYLSVGYEKASLCAQYFANIVRGSDLIGVGAVLQDTAWEARAMEPHQPPPFSVVAYEQCLREALVLLCEAAANIYPGEQITVICDRDAKAASIHAVFDAVQKEKPALFSMTVAGKDEKSASDSIIPLQVADMAAGLIRRAWLLELNKQWKGFDLEKMRGELPGGRGGKWFDFAVFGKSSAKELGRIFKNSIEWQITYQVPGLPPITYTYDQLFGTGTTAEPPAWS